MKLLSKLTLYNAISKTVIVLLFIWLLPTLVNDVVSAYTNYYLKEQKKKVLDNIQKNGIDYYLGGDSSYGSYAMLKEEYISLEPAPGLPVDTILTSKRIVENDTLTYRLLNYVFTYRNKKYLLEIGRTTASITQYNRPLQRVALYVLAGLIALTLIVDLIFTRLLLRPLGEIIRTKLHKRKFPFKESLDPVNTSTTDFRYLDSSLIDLMNKIKDAFEKEREFTSNASHELMTPISILQTKLENLLVDIEINEYTQEKIAGMMNTLNRLKKIVRSLLLISRIENDQFAKSDQVNPRLLITEITKELEDRLDARGILISQSLSANITLQHINRDLLFQLLYNLVNNAIRYNKENGQIRISDSIMQDNSYKIIIEDTGIGIQDADLDSIFNRFKKTSKVEGEGYGLGLSIVKTIAQYHDTRIDVQSEYGTGTTFTIVFPAKLIVFPTIA